MTTLTKGDKVTVTNYCGSTVEPQMDKKYQLIGQTGYVQEVRAGGYFYVALPEHIHHSKGKGALLTRSEIAPA